MNGPKRVFYRAGGLLAALNVCLKLCPWEQPIIQRVLCYGTVPGNLLQGSLHLSPQPLCKSTLCKKIGYHLLTMAAVLRGACISSKTPMIVTGGWALTASQVKSWCLLVSSGNEIFSSDELGNVLPHKIYSVPAYSVFTIVPNSLPTSQLCCS